MRLGILFLVSLIFLWLKVVRERLVILNLWVGVDMMEVVMCEDG